MSISTHSNVFLALALLALIGCTSAPQTAHTNTPNPTQFQRDMDIICTAITREEFRNAEPDVRQKLAAQYIDAHIRSEDGRGLFEALPTMPPDTRMEYLERYSQKANLTACPLLDVVREDEAEYAAYKRDVATLCNAPTQPAIQNTPPTSRQDAITNHVLANAQSKGIKKLLKTLPTLSPQGRVEYLKDAMFVAELFTCPLLETLQNTP